jgi:carbamoyl-phosphate synthase large subunit
MLHIGEPIPESRTVTTLAEAKDFAHKIGLPLVVRPAYTLGGTGGGIATTENEFLHLVQQGLAASPINQVLLERSLAGWKEIEFEVIRDAAGKAITVCGMENLDPMGVHTGDSIVVAPTQTLSAEQYHILRQAALKIVSALGIAGGCNVQLALEPNSLNYNVIEVNPRLSRSSALASKATGYPIARIAAKIALGYNLTELPAATEEPKLDYTVVKFPSWPFDKFTHADRRLGTQMKATGEVMALGTTFTAALLKAVRSLSDSAIGLALPPLADWPDDKLQTAITYATDLRLFALYEGLRRGFSGATLNQWSHIDPWFIKQLAQVADLEKELKAAGSALGTDLLQSAKKIGFGDADIARLTGLPESQVRLARQKAAISPGYLAVGTEGSPTNTPYYYSSYETTADKAPALNPPRAVVLGAGPIRIGQGIEFDYSSVKAAQALREEGYASIIINNNPETVSTDGDVSDRLYFEPLTAEDVENILVKEKPSAVFTQFGGQGAIKLGAPLSESGYPLAGSNQETIDLAEDRDRFRELLQQLNIPQPAGATATSLEQALKAADDCGYPVLVRPSYVLGGQAMKIVNTPKQLKEYAAEALTVSGGHPLLIDKYLAGQEIEVDAVADGKEVLIPGILEHVERAGVHSGDSIAIYPARDLTPEQEEAIVNYTWQMSRGLKIKGLLNIQFVLHQGQVYVIEANPRASRTVPFLSKVTGVPLVKLAVQVSLGQRLADLGWGTGLLPARNHVAVKVPVFSTGKLPGVEAALGPEMRSTGEVVGFGTDLPTALWTGFLAAGYEMPRQGTILATIADRDKDEALPYLAQFAQRGFNLVATAGTANFLAEHGITARIVRKVHEQPPHILTDLSERKVDLVINTVTCGQQAKRDGFLIRRAAVENSIPCFTSLDTVKAYLTALDIPTSSTPNVRSLQEYLLGSHNPAKQEQ